MKQNLPVLLLKDLILLPSNDIRLEFDNDISKTIIDVAEIFHNSLIFVVSQKNPLEENPDITDLPKVGVIGRINHKLELPNGKTRVVITGFRRAYVNEYSNPEDDITEAVVSEVPIEDIPNDVSIGTIRKLYHELEQYTKNVPYVSNGLLALISNTKDISKLTDIVVTQISLGNERLMDYVNQVSALKRVEMILEDIYKEEQLYEIEKRIDSKVKKEIDNSQKEYLLREKYKVIKEELGEDGVVQSECDELREKVNNLNCEEKIRNRILKEIKRFSSVPTTSPEIGIIRNYIDWLLNLPGIFIQRIMRILKKLKEI